MGEFSKRTGLNHREARTEEQKRLMAQIEQDGVCPFCAAHFTNYHPKPIIFETDSWFVTTNMSPYEGTKYHFLFVYKPAHIASIVELPIEGWNDLHACVHRVVTEHHITGGSFFMRFGDTRYTGSSVEHLHAHLIVGDIDNPDHHPVRVKLG
jgi:diadenosine tetraphosphate (Ap4A) HIT family hydrolase